MSVLAVVAHPDDEALGPGGTLAVRARAGERVHLHVLCGAAEARSARPNPEQLGEQLERSCAALGVEDCTRSSFANVRMNVVPALELVRDVEKAIERTRPEVVYTHFAGDVNDDHGAVFRATLAAVRLPERHPGGDLAPVRALYAFETPTSTDWAWRSGPEAFRPNAYVDVAARWRAKCEAVSAYREVPRPDPHPTAEGTREAAARARGAEGGCLLAEGHRLVFRRGWSDAPLAGGRAPARVAAIGPDAGVLLAATGGSLVELERGGAEVHLLLGEGADASLAGGLPGARRTLAGADLGAALVELEPHLVLVDGEDEPAMRAAVRAARRQATPASVLAFLSPETPPSLLPGNAGLDVVADVGAAAEEKERLLSRAGLVAVARPQRDALRALAGTFGLCAAEGFHLLWERQVFTPVAAAVPERDAAGRGARR